MKRTIQQWKDCDPAFMAYHQSVEAIRYAFEDAKADILHLAAEIERLRECLTVIALPRRGFPESYWNVDQVGNFAAESLATQTRPTLPQADAAPGGASEVE